MKAARVGGEHGGLQRRYYANERNPFWPTLASLCGVPASAPYEDRVSALARHGIGGVIEAHVELRAS